MVRLKFRYIVGQLLDEQESLITEADLQNTMRVSYFFTIYNNDAFDEGLDDRYNETQ